MANVLYTPQQAARSTLAALRYLTVLPRTVRQDFSQEFVAGRGRTVDIVLPSTVGNSRQYTDANRSARDAIVFDDIDQDTIPVTMDTQVYKAVRLPDDFNTFTLTNMEQQVLRPQAESVVDGITAPLVTAMQSIATATNLPFIAADGSNFRSALIQARRVLNARKVPLQDRFVAVGSSIEAAALSDVNLQKVNESGSDGVLREAIIGRLFGFTIIADPNLSDNYAVAYHRDAFAHVTRPSKPPVGAAFSAAIAQDGFALRWLQHYNPLQLEDQSVVDAFVGAKVLDPNRAVAFSTASASIDVTPASQTIAVGEKLQLVATDAAGEVIPAQLVSWVSGTPSRATVSSTGLVTGVATGSAATITATYQTHTDTSAITVS